MTRGAWLRALHAHDDAARAAGIAPPPAAARTAAPPRGFAQPDPTDTAEDDIPF